MRTHSHYKVRPNIFHNKRKVLCDPTGGYATAGVVMALTAGAGGYSAYNQNEAGKAQASQYEYQARQTAQKKELARRTADTNSKFAQDAGASQAKEIKRTTAQLEGTQKVVMAANGIGGSVTAADITTDTFNKSKLDEVTVRRNADMTTWKAKNDLAVEEWDLNNQERGYWVAASNAKKTGQANATSTLLSTAAQVASTGLLAAGYDSSYRRSSPYGAYSTKNYSAYSNQMPRFKVK